MEGRGVERWLALSTLPAIVESVKVQTHFVTSAADPAQFPAPSAPEIAFLGRSNVGKSSLINALVNDKIAKTSNTPGRRRPSISSNCAGSASRIPSSFSSICLVTDTRGCPKQSPPCGRSSSIPTWRRGLRWCFAFRSWTSQFHRSNLTSSFMSGCAITTVLTLSWRRRLTGFRTMCCASR